MRITVTIYQQNDVSPNNYGAEIDGAFKVYPSFHDLLLDIAKACGEHWSWPGSEVK